MRLQDAGDVFPRTSRVSVIIQFTPYFLSSSLAAGSARPIGRSVNLSDGEQNTLSVRVASLFLSFALLIESSVFLLDGAYFGHFRIL
jgi:hypothetical protein